jgi:hypothetical protein
LAIFTAFFSGSASKAVIYPYKELLFVSTFSLFRFISALDCFAVVAAPSAFSAAFLAASTSDSFSLSSFRIF